MMRITQVESAKLRLARASWEDTGQLEQEPCSSLLNFVWKAIKKDVGYVFSKIGQNFQVIKSAFRVFELTMDPRITKEFDPTRNMLTINVWSLLFCVLSTDDIYEVGFSPNFEVGRTLIHEFEHYRFLKSKNMLGASEDQLNQFDAKYRSKAEEKAIKAEINYLKKCKKKLPATFYLKSFSIRSWGNKKTNLYVKRRELVTSGIIDGFLEQCYEMLELIRKDQNASAYNQESEKIAISDHKMISRALLLQINSRIAQKDFKKVQIDF